MSDDQPPAYGTGENPLSRAQAMIQFTPQARALGIEITGIGKARVEGRVPYKPEFVGDPDTGIIAGGVITTFLDHICGTAAVAAMDEPTIVATIDLRIDYMRPATPGRDVRAEAHCYKIGKSVAFVRAVAFEDSPDNPIANAVSTFMVSPNRKPGANLRERKK
jgi:uncharacterized protein (TIGR00369 family)